ncbi:MULTISPECIES: tyrosine-type recombinase/integrase [Azospirillum]|nr:MULTISPECIES: tyrosine-type recombinase/integrase [Azospirillum]MDW7555445.1 tyrosine-type recombinase/integrase [Azospirillum brasilense]MDW7595147.1 tyrosine-type recombinase/integrase [Azospirillum brasilense]MDW7630300.1 tyrosine-type recombinase/integrase [Azospirillum brasilense]MDX5949668.1 tyrosine-type recombinase/integrase [Azospirillum brasilense]TVZ67468.1 phage integrase family protein [Azospirillum brasilense]
MRKRNGQSGWDDAVGMKRGKYGHGTLGWVIGRYRLSPEYQRLAPATKKIYEAAFDRLHDYAQEEFSGLRRRHIMRVRDDLAHSPATANQVITAIGAVCRFALDREMIETDPSHRVPRLKTGEWRRWTDAELDKFYQSAYEALRRVFVMALFTGQRRADLCRATWGDIQDGGINVVQQKTGAHLWIPLHPTLERHLAIWKSDATPLPSVTILTSTDRTPWPPQVLSCAFRNEADKLGLNGCNLHGLRKTAAAKLAEAGCSARQIMAITGHSTMNEVERYTRQAEQRRLASDAIGAFDAPAFEAPYKPLKRR